MRDCGEYLNQCLRIFKHSPHGIRLRSSRRRPGARSGRAAWPSPPRARCSRGRPHGNDGCRSARRERGATHHAFLKATLTGRQALVGTITPRVQRFDARGVGHGRFERARIDDRSEAGHVTETERRGQTSLDGADLQRLAQPDHVVVAHGASDQRSQGRHWPESCRT